MNLPRIHVSYGKRLEPTRDWAVLLALSVLAVFVVLGMNMWTFQRVVRGDVLGELPQNEETVFDASRLEKLIDLFSTQASKQQEYVRGTKRFVDPS